MVKQNVKIDNVNIVKQNINVENAKLIFRNFSGKETKFNPAGSRNFCVLLETDIAKSLESDGWNVKWLKPRDPTEEEQAYIQVKVAFNKRPPNIWLITSKGKTLIKEDSINILDWAEIEEVDLIINPYNWEGRDGKRGVAAYAKSMYITIIEDDFAKKYQDVPDSGTSSPDEDLPWKD
jgi:hypothetical protein